MTEATDTRYDHSSNNRQRDLPPVDWLQSRYKYDPESGEVIGPRGKPIGSKHPRDEYIFIGIRYRGRLLHIPAHRIAYAIKTGRWPYMIRHSNGRRDDNRWANLITFATGRERRAAEKPAAE